jgi:hypothetical protein
LEVGDGGQAVEGVVVQGVVGPGATLLTLQQAGIQQLLEVVADRRLAQAQGAGELAHTDRVGAGRQQVDDPDPVGVSQGLEQPGGGLSLVVRQARRAERRAAGRRRLGLLG